MFKSSLFYYTLLSIFFLCGVDSSFVNKMRLYHLRNVLATEKSYIHVVNFLEANYQVNPNPDIKKRLDDLYAQDQ